MSNLCARCKNELQERILCSGCLDVIDEPPYDSNAPRYCSIKCLKLDAQDHEPHCGIHEKVLRRAAETAKEAFMIFRELAYEDKITQIEWTRKPILLLAAEREDFYVGPVDDSFLSHPRDQETILSYCACETALGLWGTFFYLLLEGATEKVQELDFKPSDPLVIKFNTKNESQPYHAAFQIKLKSGKSFVVDLTGAQYGHHEPVVPLFEYEKRIDSEKTDYDEGHMKRDFEGDEWQHKPELILQAQVARDMCSALEKWGNGSDAGGLQEFVRQQPKESFRKNQVELLEGLREVANSSVARLRRDHELVLDEDLKRAWQSRVTLENRKESLRALSMSEDWKFKSIDPETGQ